MAGSKESVYISVETQGVKQSAEEIKELIGPLSDISKSITALLQQQQSLSSATVKVDKMIVQSQSTLEKVTGKLAQQSQTAAGAQSALAGSLKVCSAAASGTKSSLEGVSEQGAKGMDVLGKLAGSLGGPVGSEINKVKNLFEGLKGASSGAAGAFVKFAAVAGGVALAIAAITKAAKGCLDAYDELYPESNTFNDVLKSTKESAEDLNIALEATAGEQLNALLTPALKDASEAFLEAKQSSALFFATLLSADKKGGSGFAAAVQGTIGETMISVKKLFGMDVSKEEQAIQDIAQSYYEAGVNAKQKLDENLDRARKRREEKAKEAARITGKEIKDELSAMFSEFVFSDADGGGLKLWSDRTLADFEQVKVIYSAQLKELEALEGDPKVKAALRIQLEEEMQAQLQEIRLRNARETNDQAFIIQSQYDQRIAALEEQKKQAELQKFKELQDEKARMEAERIAAIRTQEEQSQAILSAFLQGAVSTIQGPLNQAVSGVFDIISGDVEDVRQAAFNLFESMAQNLFSTSLSAIVNSVVKMAMESGASAAQTPIIGPALAIAAVSGTLAAGLAIAKRTQKQKPTIKYSTGGYVSAGMVHGAGGSGDSVEAVLQPGERVLSKEETKAYDKGLNAGNVTNIQISFYGQMTSQSQLDTWTRQSLLPSLNRALGQGYKLAT